MIKKRNINVHGAFVNVVDPDKGGTNELTKVTLTN